jgi:hypothetical protein
MRVLENTKDGAENSLLLLKNERYRLRRLPDNKTRGVINIDIITQNKFKDLGKRFNDFFFLFTSRSTRW